MAVGWNGSAWITPATPPPGSQGLGTPSSTAYQQVLAQAAANANLARSVSYPAFYDYLDGNGRKQVAKLLSATETILTSGANNNWKPTVDSDGTVLFLTDRTGHRRQFRMNQDGAQPFYAEYIPYAGQYAINHVLITGQSLAYGDQTFYALSALTAAQPYANLMFAAPGVTAGVNVLTNGTSGLSLVPLTATDTGYNNVSSYETCANGFADSISQRTAPVLYDNPNGITEHTLLMSNSGIPGFVYLQLCGPTDWNSSNPYWASNGSGSNGSPSYREMMAQVTAAKALAAAAGKSYFVPCVFLIHGEFDGYNSAYLANLVTWQSDVQTGIQAITGQTGVIPFVMMQTATASASLTAAFPNVNGFATGGPASAPTSCVAQLQAALQHPTKFILAGPEYHVLHDTENPASAGQLHPDAQGQRQMGGILSRCYERVFLEGKTWFPVMPVDVNIAGNKVVIDYTAPTAPLALDTTWVADPGNYGFQYADANGAVITSVAVTGPLQVTLTLNQNSAPTGRTLGYASPDPGNYYGPTDGGARGCLRDSGSTLAFYDTADGTPPQNYSVRWTVTI